MSREYTVLAPGCPRVVIVEQEETKFVVYKEYERTQILMFYSEGDSIGGTWVHSIPFAKIFENYADAKALADEWGDGVKVGVYYEVD